MPRTPLPSHRLGMLLLAALAATPFQSSLAQVATKGLWTTVSDRDGKPEAVVEIREVNGELVGVVRALLVAADREDSICTKCPGDRRGRPIVGMEILRHMKPDGSGAFSGGEILDPENGKTYRATMKLADGGQKLIVRGYIGLSIFGRSQTWFRRPRADGPSP